LSSAEHRRNGGIGSPERARKQPLDRFEHPNKDPEHFGRSHRVTVRSPWATAAIGNRWTKYKGSHLSPFACSLHAFSRELTQASEAVASQTAPHPSYRFHSASPRVYNVND